ncbi:ABC transporter permease [Lentzea flaviverrucosa]|uniref:Putative ABC transport system permease protein n=1 Tax=Lentzea flaviverrucosa TaxID=200379 RepID=A0A1H9W8K3_9PSEU|nr:ABC transporter permease [Lentzea flaviverrucosa]RDI22329.1 putative ABC transport system permease protein [Lentzea flaviverrucosa]SES29783.1 putative ABC transport system permease protein [Lentzea flaviverrucosa]
MLSGKFRSALVIGGQGIRARKLRTFLSMVSLFLGVLAVVAVQAGSEIAERAMLTDVELQSGKDGTIMGYVPGEKGAPGIVESTLKGRTDAVAMISSRAIIGEPGVRPINEGGMPFEYANRGGDYSGPMVYCDANGTCTEQKKEERKPDGQAIEVSMVALTGDIRPFKPFRSVSGTWLDFGTAPSLAPRIVLNEEAAKGLKQYRVPGEMMIDGATHHVSPQIIGVVQDGSMQPRVYMRLDELRTWMPAAAPTTEADRFRGGGTQLELYLQPGTDDLQQLIKAKLTGAGLEQNQMHFQTVNSKERMESQLKIMRLIFLGMAFLVLLIGVAGILNVGLATVGERVEEFALRRAVGMSRLLLAGIVLAETLLTGLLTAALAIGAGAGGLQVALMMFGSRFPSLQGTAFPWEAGVAGVIAGLIAGVLGGLIPAIRAARIPIATVMRA